MRPPAAKHYQLRHLCPLPSSLKTLLTCLTEGLLDFYLTANNETRKNVTGLIKEAISSSVRVADNNLVIGILGTAVTSHRGQIQL